MMRLFLYMNEQRNTLLHLSLIAGVGPATIDAIVGKKSEYGSLKNVYNFTEDDLVKMIGLSAKTASLVVLGLRDKKLLEDELTLLAKHQVDWLTRYDDNYPALLKHIYLPPTILYFKGVLPESNHSLSIVGSRDANAYGQRVVQQLVTDLVHHEFIIVSGGAHGIDTFAHKATLDAGGKTVVVLGSGLLRPYPAQNKKLFEAVVQGGGAVVSCFPLSMAPAAGNFPARNRIIAGLSSACAVVQAAQKSGALITADYALNQGKEVFAVPGPIDDPRSAGCHSLIAQGACIVTGVETILNHFGIQTKAPVVNRSALTNDKNSIADNDCASTILNQCRTPVAFDELLNVTAMNLTELQSILFDLQLQGKIHQNAVGLWHAR